MITGLGNQSVTKAAQTMQFDTLEDCFAQGEMIIKVKEPQPVEIALLKPHHILYTYLIITNICLSCIFLPIQKTMRFA